MKAVYSFAFLLSVFVTITIAGGPPSEEFKKIIDDCKVQEKATENDIQQHMNHQLPNTPTGKCFAACIHEKFGEIKDGKVNADAIKANFLKHAGADKAGLANEVADACKGITNADRCELGLLLQDCMMKTFAKKKN